MKTKPSPKACRTLHKHHRMQKQEKTAWNRLPSLNVLPMQTQDKSWGLPEGKSIRFLNKMNGLRSIQPSPTVFIRFHPLHRLIRRWLLFVSRSFTSRSENCASKILERLTAALTSPASCSWCHMAKAAFWRKIYARPSSLAFEIHFNCAIQGVRLNIFLLVFMICWCRIKTLERLPECSPRYVFVSLSLSMPLPKEKPIKRHGKTVELGQRRVGSSHSFAARQWMLDCNFGEINQAAERSMKSWAISEAAFEPLSYRKKSKTKCVKDVLAKLEKTPILTDAYTLLWGVS